MIDKEHVLNRWATGAGAGTIASELGCSRGGVRKIVLAAQKTGDPRAIRHDHLTGANEFDNRPPGYTPKTRAHYTAIERARRKNAQTNG